MKKCPPGVICIENVTMFFMVICVLFVTYFVYSNLFNQKIIVNNKQTDKIVTRNDVC